jgi:hypothetical protein
MKKLLAQTLALFLALVLHLPIAHSACESNPNKLCNPIAANNITELLTAILDVVVVVSIPVLVLAFIWTGFKFVTAQGNATKLDQARMNLWYTLLGAGIIIGIKVILAVIQGTVSQIRPN